MCTKKINLSRHTIDRYHKGLASIVTSGIILAAVSIMGVMLLGWSQTSISEQKQEMNDVYNSQMNKINEDLIYENIWFALPAGLMTANHLNVTISNIGILGLNVTTIQITNTTGINNTSFSYPYTNGGIVTGDSLSFNATYPWQSTDELDIRIFTSRGNQFVSRVIAP